MTHHKLFAGWPKLVVMAGLLTLGFALPMSTAFAASSSFCRTYANDYADRYSVMLPRTVSISLLRSSLYKRAYARCKRDQYP